MNEEVIQKDEDVFGLGCALEHFSEYKEVLDMIDNLKNIIHLKQSVVERAYERFVDILKQYHEQPHLLDAQLDAILNRIILIVRDPKSDIELKHASFQYMYFVVNVRGYKVVVRHLPHEVSDFEPVLRLLESQDPNHPETWTTRYVLLLWLSIIVMIPFDMSRFDGFDTSDSNSKTVMSRVLDICKTYTTVSDKCRDAAAYLVSKFLTRIDVKEKCLNEFLEWACELSISTESSAFIKYGTLASVAMIIKHAKRVDILPHANKLLQWIINAEFRSHNGSNIQKLVYKIIQRIGLTLLPPRTASWRYQRGNRSLAANLSAGDNKLSKTSLISSDDGTIFIQEEEIDVPEEMEEVIDQLIQGLRSTDGVVRWSAAKGVGRVTSRLTKELADEVVGTVLELFSPREGDGAWHGGCLALAELGRRGLLLPQRLPEVVPVVLKALVYDEPRGYSSVGSHIRDSACYVCWSFARAYDKDDLKPFVNDIAAQLLVVTCFDREINCRRAASAAFQENVGRQGTFPYGIDILTVADFFSVSIRTTSYLKISVFIAQFEEYTYYLIDHLIERKVIHWDVAIRDASAKALYNLTSLAPEYMVKEVLPNLFEKTKNIDLHCRHGSILAISEILHALSDVCKEKCLEDFIGAALVNDVKDLIPIYRERLYFRGLGGELMKEACSKYIEKCSLAHMPFHKTQITDDWLLLLNECLSYNSSTIQTRATEALSPLLNEYYNGDSEAEQIRQADIIKKYLHELKCESDQVVRKGHALALGAIPSFMLIPHINNITKGLIEATQITHTTLKWAESRRDAINSLTSISKALEMEIGSVLTEEHIKQMYECFLKGLTEYTQDKRGDIGAWVREASMSGLQTITLLLAEKSPSLLTEELVEKIMNGIVQQAVEKIDRTRAKAGKIFFSILHNEPQIPNIPNHVELIELFQNEECSLLNWYSAAATFPKFVKVIKLPNYTYNVMLGFVSSVGGMTETLVKSSSHSLFEYLKEELKSKGNEEIVRLCDIIYNIFIDYHKNDRISVPMFRFLDKLFTSGCINVVLNNDNSDFAKKILKLIQAEISGCKDIYKLIDGINVLCQFIQVKSEVCNSALFQLALLLCHKQPYVRKATSTKLFESLLVYGDNSMISEENIDEISNILSTTNWEAPIDEIKPSRNTLCGLMGIKVPVPKIKPA